MDAHFLIFYRSTRIIWSSRDTRPSRTSTIPTEECFTSNYGFKLFCSMETQCVNCSCSIKSSNSASNIPYPSILTSYKWFLSGTLVAAPTDGCHARPPFSSCPPVCPTPFLLPTLGMPHLSVASNDSLPPGVSSVANVILCCFGATSGRRFYADRTTFRNWYAQGLC